MGIYKSQVFKMLGNIIFLAGLFTGGLMLFFGLANLINPDVPEAYLTRNKEVCLKLCGIGLICLVIAFAAFFGILRKDNRTENNQRK